LEFSKTFSAALVIFGADTVSAVLTTFSAALVIVGADAVSVVLTTFSAALVTVGADVVSVVLTTFSAAFSTLSAALVTFGAVSVGLTTFSAAFSALAIFFYSSTVFIVRSASGSCDWSINFSISATLEVFTEPLNSFILLAIVLSTLISGITPEAAAISAFV